MAIKTISYSDHRPKTSWPTCTNLHISDHNMMTASHHRKTKSRKKSRTESITPWDETEKRQTLPNRIARMTRSGSSKKVSFGGNGVRINPAAKSIRPAFQNINKCKHQMHYSVHHKKITLSKLLKKLVTCRFVMKTSKNICWPYQKSYQIESWLEISCVWYMLGSSESTGPYWPVCRNSEK